MVVLIGGVGAGCAISESGAEPVSDVKTGDCLVEPPQSGASGVETVACEQPHRAEVFAEIPVDGDLPTDADVERYRNDCEMLLGSELPGGREFVGGVGAIAPTEQTWRDGDRTMACVAVFNAPRTGPIAGLRMPSSYFKVGDCLAEVPMAGPESTVVDCTKPHAAEVFAVFEMPDGAFPGQSAIQEFKDGARCGPALAAYAPAAMDDPSVRVMKGFPDEQSWALGHRAVTCFAAFDPLRTSPLQG